MAQLPPDGMWLMQQIGGEVVLFHRDTEEEVARFMPGDPDGFGAALQRVGADDRFNLEQKMFAGFWAGYFYAHATL